MSRTRNHRHTIALAPAFGAVVALATAITATAIASATAGTSTSERIVLNPTSSPEPQTRGSAGSIKTSMSDFKLADLPEAAFGDRN